MLSLHKDFYVIVDDAGKLACDCEGPIIQSIDYPDFKYFEQTISHYESTTKKSHRIAKIRVVELP